MIIMELERRTMDGKPVEYNPVYENGEDFRDWWCRIETKQEELVYDDFVEHLGQYSGDPRKLLWNKMLIDAGQGLGVCWGDDDMYGYIRPDEAEPEVGEEMTDGDGDIWVRTY